MGRQTVDRFARTLSEGAMMLSVVDRADMFVANIDVPERLRQMDSERVEKIAESMAEIGLQTPITVRTINDGESVILVAGRHRLEAASRLGWDKISVVFVEGDDDDFRLWEIAENLHRSELTVDERSAHIAEWIRLTDKKAPPGAEVSGQLAQKLSKRGRRGEGRSEGGLSAASRGIGVERTEARRATKIDSRTPEAKQACRDAGLANNQSALLKVAAAPPDQQVAVVEEIVAKKAAPPPPSGSLGEIMDLLRSRLGTDYARFQRLMRDVDPHHFKRSLVADTTVKAA